MALTGGRDPGSPLRPREASQTLEERQASRYPLAEREGYHLTHPTRFGNDTQDQAKECSSQETHKGHRFERRMCFDGGL